MSGASRNGAPPLERIGTGSAQLDAILGGGFPVNSLNIIMGHPGTGKTVLAEQLVFANAGGGRPVLYITTVSEPLSKLVTYLQQFAFYDEARMLGDVVFEDVGAALAEKGPEALVEVVRNAIREIGPKIIVVDSFKAVHDMTDSANVMRRLIADLAGLLAAYETTTFLIGEYAEEQIPIYSEFAIADGIVECARRSTAKRDERFLRVLKLRGSSYAEGLHSFTVSRRGVQVFPRLVSPTVAPDYRPVHDRVSSGNAKLDALLEGGLWAGSSTLVKGVAGTGKTTLALQFAMQALTDGETALYVNFQENPTQLERTIRALGGDLDEMTERGFHPLYMSPVELAIDRIVVDLFELVRQLRVRRVVIDALGDISNAAEDRHRFHDYLYALTQHLAVSGVTTMMTLETSSRAGLLDTLDGQLSSMSDCLIELGLDVRSEPRRTLRISKARGTRHDLRAYEMRIVSGGIELDEPVMLT